MFRDILRAISIKSVAWSYSLESQLKWILDNLGDDDEHVFLREGSKDVAYLNLVKVFFTANNTQYHAYGIGNVCAVEKGRGYGKELMMQVGDYLRNNRSCGLLFCKDALVPFYERCGWRDVNRKVCENPSLPHDVHIMTYSAPKDIVCFDYKGKLF